MQHQFRREKNPTLFTGSQQGPRMLLFDLFLFVLF